MKRFLTAIAFALFAFSATDVRAYEGETACASVGIEIGQEVTGERVAFDAKLVLTNNIPNKPLTNIRVDVELRDGNGTLKNEVFFLKVSSKNNISDVTGSGTVPAGEISEVHWLIIPSPGAGGEDPAGLPYYVGATLYFTLDGVENVVPIFPDKITVKPEAQLVFDYFIPYQVISDNPMTSDVEAAVPYQMAVRILNDGFGDAKDLDIQSAQPNIVENEYGLLVDFQILDAYANDEPTGTSLNINVGDIASKNASTAYWEMIATLSGRFEEFDASFTHAAELGGSLTSLILETNTHYLSRMIKANLPGRDALLDFLAEDIVFNGDGDIVSSTHWLYESEIPGGATDRSASISSVTVVEPVGTLERPTAGAPSINLMVDLPAAGDPVGWIYLMADDPSGGMLELVEVVRWDGVKLDPHNYWIEEGLDEDYQATYTVKFVDYRATGTEPEVYTLAFTEPDVDTIPPTSAVIFDGPDTGPFTDGGPVFITPETRVVMTAQDDVGGSGVAQMLRRIVEDNGDFQPALPFNLMVGAHSLEYYSVDKDDNAEAVNTIDIVVDDAVPFIAKFELLPDAITPYAPEGLEAARGSTFLVNVTDIVGIVDVKIEVVDGGGVVVRSFDETAASGEDLLINWDGTDSSGVVVDKGSYTVRLVASDGLDNIFDNTAPTHTSTATKALTVSEWITEETVSGAAGPGAGADQKHPAISGTTVVWQDMRDGNWDIYKRVLPGGAEEAVATGTADQERPDIDDVIVVWQEFRGGSWDVYGYDLSKPQETALFPIATGTGDETNPAVSGTWVVWQDNSAGNWDIYAMNTATSDPAVRITSHERDQINPVIDGDTVVWEDLRHGAGEIYRYFLAAAAEERVTYNVDGQTLPAVSGDTLVWADERGGEKDIYWYTPARGVSKATYGASDDTEASVFGNLLVYTDYGAGPDDPNLSFLDLLSGVGGTLVSAPARQEAADVGNGYVVWQDSRSGVFQVYWAEVVVTPLPVTLKIRPGFNLIAVGERLATKYATAQELISGGLGEASMERVMAYNYLHNTYTEVPGAAADFPLVTGMGLVVYASGEGTVEVANPGEELPAGYSLVQGSNTIGILSVSPGYSAHDLIDSVGIGNIQSVRRFDNWTGSWETVSVRSVAGGFEKVGHNFTIKSGEGLIITMKKSVGGWRP